LWAEIPTFDGLNLLIGNHYFPPDNKPEIVANYFRFLEKKLDRHYFHVIIFGDFNTLVSTGNVVCLCLIPIIILNLREMQPTPPRVFSTLTNAMIMSAAVIYLI
jgi:hypothetical protein